ncbi:MAG: hypothetical protein H6728_04535 [Myxococcales bacterium]|nr:hypothetical protein [Myxococcales bacterium]MCB9642320.1 hypothetical protein [Myxococcales bacterium]
MKDMLRLSRNHRGLQLRGLFLLFVLSCAFPTLVHAAPQPSFTPKGIAGYYDQAMSLGIDHKNGLLTGYYHTAIGYNPITKGPSAECTFQIHGRFEKDHYKLKTWYPSDKEVITGTLRFLQEKGRILAHLRLDQEHGGCGRASPLVADKQGVKFTLTRPNHALFVRVVKVPKVHFYPQPLQKKQRKAYILQRQMVEILKIQKGWSFARYANDQTPPKITKGWLPDAAFFPTTPPSPKR